MLPLEGLYVTTYLSFCMTIKSMSRVHVSHDGEMEGERERE